MTTVVLPWRHASELAFVRDCFFPRHATSVSNNATDIYSAPLELSDNTTAQQQSNSTISKYKTGLDRVAIWNFRSPKSVPHAVDATAMLIEARYNDKRNTVAEEAFRNGAVTTAMTALPLSESSISSLYSMAFIKFVNGFVDRDVSRSMHRTGLSKPSTPSNAVPNAWNTDDNDELSNTAAVKGTGESSMYAHAATIGMHVQFVDLRHRCVHASGKVEVWELRKMCERALEWLWERWWKDNADGDAGRWLWEVEMAEQRKRKRSEGAD